MWIMANGRTAAVALVLMSLAGAPATMPAPTKTTTDPELMAALGRKAPALHFDGNALADAIDYFQAVTRTNIAVNWRALKGVGIDPGTPITVRLKGLTLAAALDGLLVAAGGTRLAYVADENVVTVLPAGMVEQERARDAALKTLGAGDAAATTSLDRRLAEITFKGDSVIDVLQGLRNASGATIDVDWDALTKAGVGRDEAVTLHLTNVRLGKAMEVVAGALSTVEHPLGVKVSGGVIWLTGMEAAGTQPGR